MNLFEESRDIAILKIDGQYKRHTEKTKRKFGNGLDYILYQLGIYNEKYIHYTDIKKYKYVLIPFTSYYDILNFVYIYEKIDKGNAILIGGGAGLNNPKLFEDIIDYQIIGRGEESVKNLIFNNDTSDFYHKDNREIRIIQPKYLINYCGYQEKSVGCSMGCNFCQYGAKFKNSNNKYCSGENLKEDFISSYDFENIQNGTTAIDGSTQEIRYYANKKISDESIVEKLKTIYDTSKNNHKLKIYNIVGLPGENPESLINIREYFKKADKKSNKKLTVWIHATHFVPMKFTKFENENVSMYDYRNYILENRWVESFYDGDSIQVSWTPHITGLKITLLHEATQKAKSYIELKEKINEINNYF